MTYKEKVLSVYPNACVFEDTHHYSNFYVPEHNYPFKIFLKRIPFKENSIKADITEFKKFDKIINFPGKLNEHNNWARTEKMAWRLAWKSIQNEIMEKLAL
jgi:hypothetical protein